MKKAYIILAHKNPKQLFRLVKALDDQLSAFFIHIDKTISIEQFEKLNIYGDNVQFIERVNSAWGGFGTVEAELNGLKAVRNSKINFDRIFLLSGQDYPIKSNDYINNFLETSPYSVFVEYYPIPNYPKWPGNDRGGWYRVDRYYVGLKWYELFHSKAKNFLLRFIPALRRKIPNKLQPFTGSTWWSVDMYALNYILDYNAEHPEYRAFHKSTFVPDELFVHMILANSNDEKLKLSIENNDRRLIIWETSYIAHPNILRKVDFETIRTSEQLFARKFDEKIDEEILDLIDKSCLHVNNVT